MNSSESERHRRRSRLPLVNTRGRVLSAYRALEPFNVLMLLFVLVFMFLGGSARNDQLAHVGVRVVAIAVICASTFRSFRTAPRSLFVPAALLAAVIAIACIHLLPLPPSLWTALPGRLVFADLAAIAGFSQPWRPLAIAPDLALNALLSLVVPTAVLYGLAVVEPEYRRWIATVVLTVVVASLGIGLIQLSTGSSGFTAIYQLQWRETSPGIFANRNHQALLLAMGLPLLAGWEEIRAGGARGVAARWSASLIATLIVVIIVATGSRAGLVLGACGVLGGMAVIWSWRRAQSGPSRRRTWLLATASVVSTIGIVILTALSGRGEALDRVLAVDPLTDKRAQALPTILEMTKSYFPVGSGLGSFDVAFRLAEPLDLLEPTYFNQAHNDFIQIVLEVGLPGLVLLITGMAWLAIACFRLWRIPSASRVVVGGRAASIALVLALLASAVDYPLRTSTMMAIFCALVFQIAVALDQMRQSGQADGGGVRFT